MKATHVKKINNIGTYFSFILVLIAGIVFLFFAIKLNMQKIPENYMETEATITKIEEILLPGHNSDNSEHTVEDYEFHVYVEYSYDGEKYSNAEYGSYNSDMEEGDTVLLYLNPQNPNEFMYDPSDNFIYLIISIAVILIGIGGIAYKIYESKKEKKQ